MIQPETVQQLYASTSKVAKCQLDFHGDFIGLTGPKEEILSVARKFRVYFSASNFGAEDSKDYLVDHSAFVYLMGPKGEFVDLYGSDRTAKDVSESITTHISRGSH